MRELSFEQRGTHTLSVGAAHGSGRGAAQGTGLVRYGGRDGDAGRTDRSRGNLGATGIEFRAGIDHGDLGLPLDRQAASDGSIPSSFASEAETVYRSVCMFLLARDLTGASDSSGFADLKDLYENLHIVNRDMSRRLGAATRTDPARNAMALLDSYTTLLPAALETSLQELKPLFDAWRGTAISSI